MRRPKTHIVPMLVVAVLAIDAANGRAQPRAQPPMINNEPAVRAKFVDLMRSLWDWPPAAAPSAGAPFKIGILGNDPFQQGQINHLDKRLAGKKDVLVTRFAKADAIAPCHILVVSQAADLAAALKKTQKESVLVIAQAPGLAQQGAVLNLPAVQNKVEMEINLSAAKKAGLTPDPRLLRIAKKIYR